jgi:hypothetical protein
VITGAELLAAGTVGAALLAAAALAGPTLVAGGVLGVALVLAIYLAPSAGLALMILSGTALQVLGSEHVIGMPLSLGKAAGLATLGAWLLRVVLQRRALTWSPQIAAFLVFLVAVWASGFVTPDPAEAREALFRFAQVFLLFFMIANIAGESEARLDHAVIALSASMTVSSLIGLAEFFLPSLSIDFDDPTMAQGSIGAVVDRDSLDGVEIKRITGGLGDSNWFSYTLASVLPLNLYLFHRATRTHWRVLIAAAAALQSGCVVLSFTRSAVMALVVAVVVLVVRRRIPIKPLAVAVAIGLAGLFLWNPPGLQRIHSVEYAKAGSTPLRSLMLHAGADLILQKPITGYGYYQFGPNFMQWLRNRPGLDPEIEHWEDETIRRVNSGAERFEWIMPHNTLVQVWVEYGLLGTWAFAAFVWLFLRDVRIAQRTGGPGETLLADCLLAGGLAFLVCAVFGHLLLLKIVWMLGALAAGLRRVVVTGLAGNPGGRAA